MLDYVFVFSMKSLSPSTKAASGIHSIQKDDGELHVQKLNIHSSVNEGSAEDHLLLGWHHLSDSAEKESLFRP